MRKRELPEVERRLGYLTRVERIVSQFPDVLKWKGILDPKSFQFKFRVNEFEMMLKFPGKCRYFKDEGSFFYWKTWCHCPCQSLSFGQVS